MFVWCDVPKLKGEQDGNYECAKETKLEVFFSVQIVNFVKNYCSYELKFINFINLCLNCLMIQWDILDAVANSEM